MRISNTNNINFNARFSLKKYKMPITVGKQERIAEDTIAKKTGLSYIYGVMKNIYNFLFRKKASDATIIRQKAKILEKKIADKNGFIQILPQETSGQFITKNNEKVTYYSPKKGSMYVSIERPNKPEIKARLAGGNQYVSQAEAKKIINLANYFENPDNLAKAQQESNELVIKLFNKDK